MWSGAVHYCTKFHCYILISCGGKSFFHFCWFGREMLIQAPFGFFGILTPQTGVISTKPKRHVLGRKDVIWLIDRQKSVQWCDLWTKWRNKKDKERNPTVTNWPFAQTTHVVAALYWFACVSSYHGNSRIFQVSSKSVQGLWATGCRNLSSPIDLTIGLYNSLYKSWSSSLSDDSIICKETLNIVCTECPADFTYISSVNGCYKVVTHGLDWSTAGRECRSLHKDAHLLIINDGQEQAAVAGMLDRQCLVHVFIHCFASRI